MEKAKTTTGDVTLPDCPPGHARSTKDIACVPEVHFHREPNISLYDAQTRCVENAWVMATAQELQAAWDKLEYNNFSYGMTAHGLGGYKMALPIQKDLSPSLKRGSNVGITGGNDGFYYVQAEAVTRKQEIVTFVEVTIVGDTPKDCLPGQIRNATGKCIPEVQFFRWFDPAGFNLEAAQIICLENGWALATAAEVEAAWANTSQPLDHLVYGMLADGRFAVPVQEGNDAFQRSPNIGAEGGNEGFFYVLASAASRTQDAPAQPLRFFEFFEAGFKYATPLRYVADGSGKGPGGRYGGPYHDIALLDDPLLNDLTTNWMIEMWHWENPLTISGGSVLVAAAKAYLQKKGFPLTDGVLQQLAASIKSDPVTRYKFAPFLLKVCYDALVTKTPTSGQQSYRFAFERYQSRVDYDRAVATLEAWKQYQGKSNLMPQKYSPATLSVVFNKPPEVAGFMEGDPLEFGLLGGRAVGLLFLPLAANAGLLDDYPVGGEVAKMGDDLMGVVVGAGIGSAASISVGLVGSTYAFMKHAASEFTKNVVLANQNILNSAKLNLQGAQLELGRTSDRAARLLAKLKIAGFEKEIGAATKKIDSALKQVGKIAPKISKLLGPAIIAITAAVTIGMEIAEAVKRDAYEKKLREAANPSRTFSVTNFLNVSAQDRETRRTALFTLMTKHLIANPVTYRRLSLALPLIPEPVAKTALDVLTATVRSSYTKEVKFHSQNSMTLAQVQDLAKQKGWFLATEAEVQEAWTHHQLHVFAYGMMASGRFAVPLQRDHANFKKGLNIVAAGGNQGFFYTTHKEVKFHSQHSMTLAEASLFALQHAWLLATPSEVWNAWTYHQLDVYAYGMMADGSFAVPVQSDHSNFKKGPNIGTTDGNQGFFYTESKPSAAAQAALDELKAKEEAAAQATAAAQLLAVNRMVVANARAEEYALIQLEDNLHHKVLVAGDNSDGSIRHQAASSKPNASWQFIPAGDGYYYIIDRKDYQALVAGDTANNRVYHQVSRGRDNAKWKLESLGNGTFHITDKKHGKSLVAGTNYDGNVYHQTPQGRENAVWKLKIVGSEKGSVPAEMYARIQLEDNLHHMLLVAGDNSDGSIGHQAASSKPNASWQFIPTGDGYYYIIDSKHYLALVAADIHNNRLYHQKPQDRDNAKWKLESLGNSTFHITDKKHGRSLVAGTKYFGAVYHQYPQDRQNAIWTLKVVGAEKGITPKEMG